MVDDGGRQGVRKMSGGYGGSDGGEYSQRKSGGYGWVKCERNKWWVRI